MVISDPDLSGCTAAGATVFTDSLKSRHGLDCCTNQDFVSVRSVHVRAGKYFGIFLRISCACIQNCSKSVGVHSSGEIPQQGKGLQSMVIDSSEDTSLAYSYRCKILASRRCAIPGP